MADQQRHVNRLKGDRVLIVGGTSGIGFTVAEICIEEGCTVIISGSSTASAAKALAKLQADYPSAKDRISSFAAALADGDTVEANIASLFDAASKTGKLDHVVYTAGDALAMQKLDDVTVESIKIAGMVRFFAQLLVAKHAVKHLNPGPKSSITLTTGSVAERPFEGWTVVGSLAAGIQGMARQLAVDIRPIRANAVGPGPVDTGLWRLNEEERRAFNDATGAKSSTGIIGQVDDVAQAYVALMKDRNCTGSTYSTHGGTLFF